MNLSLGSEVFFVHYLLFDEGTDLCAIKFCKLKLQKQQK